MSGEEINVPKKTKGDAVYATAKAVISAIPILGGPAAEIFQYIVQPPLEKRKDQWMIEVSESLVALGSKGLNIEDLKNNEEFISTLMHATQIAIRTHQEGKRIALRNAIINVAKSQAPEDSLQNVFLNLIDYFTETHLRILKVFQQPKAPPGLSGGGLGNVLEHNLPELQGKRELYDHLWKDLYFRGLVSTENLHVTMTSDGLKQKRTTKMGDSFLQFIEDDSEFT